MMNEWLKRVAVIGAAGKMGRGIALLLLQEMATLAAVSGESDFSLVLVDADEKALGGLRKYLKTNLIKFAEKNINALRAYYAHESALVENADMIATFVENGLAMVSMDTDVRRAARSHLIFEAVLEDIDVKTNVYTALKEAAGEFSPYYFSNTSSIPISLLNEKCGLNNRIVGMHFYNPPAVQRLVELITYPEMEGELKNLSLQLSKRLGKTVIHSHDVAGFIGNGHFAREISYACEIAKTDPQLICQLDAVTREWLRRPMGIFQLIDYVGLDVAKKIFNVLHTYLPDLKLHSETIDAYLSAGIKGGQNPDGSQRDGIFKYEKGKPTAVYSLIGRGYEPLTSAATPPPRENDLQKYFKELFSLQTAEAKMAQQFLLKSRSFANELVQTGVADSAEDVNAVLQLGFAHPYGPVNSYY